MTKTKDDINNFFDSIELVNTETYRNMTVIGVNSNTSENVDLMMLDTGLEMGLVEISEVDDGVVSELNLHNKAVVPLLIIDGEEIEGAKQNRIINSTLIIAPNTTRKIPVSCTEEGRWHYKSPPDRTGSRLFTSSRHMATSSIRRDKSRNIYSSLKNNRNYKSDQSKIWDNISTTQADLNVNSDTHAQKDTYESIEYKLEEYMKHFSVADKQNGIIVIINGKVKGMELLYDESKYKRYHDKIIKSYIIDAVTEVKKEVECFDENILTRDFIRKIKESELEIFDCDNEGDDYRIDNDKITGFTLVYNSNIINASLFSVEE